MNNDHVIKNENNFNVIGIAIRTTNKAAIENGTIAKLWQQFFVEQILSKIPNKLDNSVIALYYNFENNRDGQYDLLLGARVSSVDEIPVGMLAQHVHAEKRTTFMSEEGPISNIVFDLWKKIWNLEDQGKLDRTYHADYELYDEKSHHPQQAQVEIHIGIK